jgi:hypothetical protein
VGKWIWTCLCFVCRMSNEKNGNRSGGWLGWVMRRGRESIIHSMTNTDDVIGRKWEMMDFCRFSRIA